MSPIVYVILVRRPKGWVEVVRTTSGQHANREYAALTARRSAGTVKLVKEVLRG